MKRLGLLLVTVTITVAVIGPWLWGTDAALIDSSHLAEGHSSAHFFGTDDAGHDILALTLTAARESVRSALYATLIGAVLGLGLGAVPALLPRRLARFATGLTNSLGTFPVLLIAMFGAIVTGGGARGAVLGIGIAAAPGLARRTHTLAAAVAGSDFVAAARMLGVKRFRVLVRHVLPNIAEPLMLTVAASFGSSLLGLATLSLLGLGVQPPDFDWGRLLHDALPRFAANPEVAVPPALAIAFTGIAFSLLGLARPASGRRAPAAGGSGADLLGTREAARSPTDAALEIRDLTVAFGDVIPVRGLSLAVFPGEIVGIVGESGSGKSLTALAVGGLVPHPGRVSGQIIVGGHDLTAMSRKELGTTVAMVFQDPMTALNPALKVGGQLAEVATAHLGLSRRQAWKRAVERLEKVHIPTPGERAGDRPHEFSGGMRQRAVIAMGLMADPKLIIADEPTTALDVTVQRQVLSVLREVNADTGAAVVFISHDIAVVSELCHRVVVMYAGRVVEELIDLRAASHPYTRALIGALPDMSTDRTQPLATIPGRRPDPAEVPAGCAFAPRCGIATTQCHTALPPLAGGVACWHPVVAREAVHG
jgi:oligopeptide/dipeptide ABC transporter ATP-binding protein